MSKTTWIVLGAVLLVILFRDRLFGSAAPTTYRPPGYDYFGGPVPAPSYAASPPTHQSASVTDLINSAINAAGSIFGGAFKGSNTSTNPGAVTPAPVTTTKSTSSGTVLLA